nr:serine/threonine-protein kinase [Kineosporia mesophila]
MSPLRAGDPATIGTFRLVARLGTGGMGVVYVGTDAAGRPAAVKAVKAEYAADPRFRSRFRREVEAVRAVTGACTARVLDADPDADEPWLATEYVGGASLDDVVNADGPLTPELLHALASGLAEALCAIHAAGVVHRDLKPANVLLAPDGPKVIDFGIAALETATLSSRTGVGMGSPGYMAPEQITGTTAIGPPADVYAWGLTVLFAATGHPPFGSGPAPALMYRAVHADVDLSGLPQWIEPLVRATLDPEPARRPDAGQVLAGLVDENERTRSAGRGAQAAEPGSRRGRRAAREAAAAPGPANAREPWNPDEPAVARTALFPAEPAAAETGATQRVLRREWHQPAAAQAPSLPSQPLYAPGPTQMTGPDNHRSRVALALTSAAVVVLAGALVWILFLAPDGQPDDSADPAPTASVTSTSSSSPEETTTPGETPTPEATETSSSTEETTPATTFDENGIASYSTELGDLDLASSFSTFIVSHNQQVVRIDASAPNSDHIDKNFVEHPGDDDEHDEPHFTLFECNGLADGQEPDYAPDAPCAAATYLLDLDDDGEATFDFSKGAYHLDGYFEVDIDGDPDDRGATVVTLSGVSTEDAVEN